MEKLNVCKGKMHIFIYPPFQFQVVDAAADELSSPPAPRC